MITCDRCGEPIKPNEYWGDKLAVADKIACVPCWKEFKLGEEKIIHELQEKRRQLMENWLNEWLKNCDRNRGR